MFDYDGDTYASHEDYRALLATVIQETFPSSRCTVLIRKTKAMAFPRVSISVDDGPDCTDLVDAIPLLAGYKLTARWAHCGKVLPELGYSVRVRPGGALAKMANALWQRLARDMKDAFFCASTGRLNPAFTAKHRRQLSERAKQAHPAQNSPTMKLIKRGHVGNIEEIAWNQRRDDFALATPEAKAPGQAQPTSAGRKRL